MSDSDSKSDVPLEGLLRRWGADEAMNQADIPAPPKLDKQIDQQAQAPKAQEPPVEEPKTQPDKEEQSVPQVEEPAPQTEEPQTDEPQAEQTFENFEFPASRAEQLWGKLRGKVPPGVLRFLPTIAATVILIVAVIVFFSADSNPLPNEQIQRELTQALADRDQAQNDLEKAKKSDKDTQAKLILAKIQIEKLVTTIKTMNDEHSAGKTELTKLKKDLTSKIDMLAEMKVHIEAARGELKDAKKLAEYKDKSQAELVREVDARNEAISIQQNKLKLTIEEHEKSIVENRKAVAQALVLRAENRTLLSDAQKLYLLMRAPDRTGLEARKRAAARAKMLAWRKNFTNPAESSETAELMERLVVIFTKLDLLDASDHGDVRAFTAMLVEGDIPNKLDSALRSQISNEDMRAWLFEAQLILTGIDRVD